jgi:site-specific DNA recombinase
MRAVGYVRVSSTEQATKGLGLPVQEQAVVDFCRREGYELVEVFSDPGVSGTLHLHERPGLRAALEAVSERSADPVPVTAIVVARWDRLGRDTYVSLACFGEFARHGCEVQAADGSGADQMSREIYMVFAGAARRELVARLRAGREAKAARGGYAGGRPPFGYRAEDGGLVPHEVHAAIVQKMFHRVAYEGYTLRRLAAEMDAVRSAGRRWDHSKVRAVLRREQHKLGPDPIVDPRIFNKAQRAIDSRRKQHAVAA